MSKIKIITDSCCDLTKEVVDELGIKVLPLSITINGETFREMYDKSADEFYDLLLKSNEPAKHAAINPTMFEEAYKEAIDEGYTDIITVSLNGLGSVTYNNAILAKDELFDNNPELKDKIRIFNLDSKCYTVFYGYPIMEAVKKINKGATAEDIVAYLQDWFDVCAVYAVPYNLKFAKKSGRISAAAAFAGELLGLKPIIEFADGAGGMVDDLNPHNISLKMVGKDFLESAAGPEEFCFFICSGLTVGSEGFSPEVQKNMEGQYDAIIGRK